MIAVLFRSDSPTIPAAADLGSNYLIDRYRIQPIASKGVRIWPQKVISRNNSGYDLGQNNFRNRKDGRTWLGGRKGENMKKMDRSQPYGPTNATGRMMDLQSSAWNTTPVDDTYIGVNVCSSPVVLAAGTAETILPMPCVWVTMNIWYTIECFARVNTIIS